MKGGGGIYSYIRALPDEFLLKSESKEISRAEQEYMKLGNISSEILSGQ